MWRSALETGVWLLLVFLALISVPIVMFQSVSLNRHGGEASGMAEMGMVAGGQHSGDWRGDQRGDWHRNWSLVGLVVLTWWSVFGFGGRRLVGWVAMGLLGF